MSRPLLKHRAGTCLYPVDDGPPMLFCCEPVRGSGHKSYCVTHAQLCSDGPGKNWRALAGMMESVEQTVQPVRGHKKRDGKHYRDSGHVYDSEITEGIDGLRA